MNTFTKALTAIQRHPRWAMSCGIAIWVLPVLLSTGTNGMIAIANAVGFVAVLHLLSMPVRTITLQTVVSMFLMGGGMMGVALLLAWLTGLLLGDGAMRQAIQPPLEEILFLLPPALTLFRWRYSSFWTLGATDVMLMFAASGAGFAMVEEASIRQHQGWTNVFAFLPMVELAGDRIHGYHVANGHAVWATLAGACLGIALVLRHRKQVAVPLAVAGIALGVLDHLTLNLRGSMYFGMGVFDFFLAGGYLTTIAFFMSVIGAIGIDWMVQHGKLRPSWIPRWPPVRGYGRSGWEARLDLRSLVFAAHQMEHASDQEKWIPQRMAGFLLERLAVRRLISQEKMVLPEQSSGEPSSPTSN